MKTIICPICGEKTTDTGRETTDGRLILSCGDASRKPKPKNEKQP